MLSSVNFVHLWVSLYIEKMQRSDSSVSVAIEWDLDLICSLFSDRYWLQLATRLALAKNQIYTL
jgi:hypothetical protein